MNCCKVKVKLQRVSYVPQFFRKKLFVNMQLFFTLFYFYSSNFRKQLTQWKTNAYKVAYIHRNIHGCVSTTTDLKFKTKLVLPVSHIYETGMLYLLCHIILYSEAERKRKQCFSGLALWVGYYPASVGIYGFVDRRVAYSYLWKPSLMLIS